MTLLFQRRSSVNYLTLDNNVSNDFTTSSDKFARTVVEACKGLIPDVLPVCRLGGNVLALTASTPKNLGTALFRSHLPLLLTAATKVGEHLITS